MSYKVITFKCIANAYITLIHKSDGISNFILIYCRIANSVRAICETTEPFRSHAYKCPSKLYLTLCTVAY